MEPSWPNGFCHDLSWESQWIPHTSESQFQGETMMMMMMMTTTTTTTTMITHGIPGYPNFGQTYTHLPPRLDSLTQHFHSIHDISGLTPDQVSRLVLM